MDTADKFIESLLTSGKSLDDIGQELSDALNRKQKELDEKEKRKLELYKLRSDLIDNVATALDIDVWTWNVAASAATLAAINQKIVTNEKDADRFFRNALQVLNGKVTIKREEEYNDKELDEDWKKINEFLRRLGL